MEGIPDVTSSFRASIVTYLDNLPQAHATLATFRESDWGSEPAVFVQPPYWPRGKPSASANYKRALVAAEQSGADFAPPHRRRVCVHLRRHGRVASQSDTYTGVTLTSGYDRAGDRVRLTDGSVTVTSGYDDAHRLSSQAMAGVNLAGSGAGVVGGARVAYTYTDRNERLTAERYTSVAGAETKRGVTTYSYDGAGRAATVAHADAAGTTVLAAWTYAYDNAVMGLHLMEEARRAGVSGRYWTWTSVVGWRDTLFVTVHGLSGSP